jgi:hypothetical protein
MVINGNSSLLRLSKRIYLVNKLLCILSYLLMFLIYFQQMYNLALEMIFKNIELINTSQSSILKSIYFD